MNSPKKGFYYRSENKEKFLAHTKWGAGNHYNQLSKKEIDTPHHVEYCYGADVNGAHAWTNEEISPADLV